MSKMANVWPRLQMLFWTITRDTRQRCSRQIPSLGQQIGRRNILFAVVFGRPNFIEVAFARFKLVDGTGCSFVYSHRIYGEKMGDEMSAWLSANGSDVEKALMEWSSMPSPIKSTWLQSSVSRSFRSSQPLAGMKIS